MTSTSPAQSYEIHDELTRFDLDRVHHWLSTDAYWALGRSRETVALAARNSVNLGAFTDSGEQVAYARIVTDHATFAWVCDVYVDAAHRGRGLGGRLAEAVVAVVRPLELTRVMLATLDAHEVYARVGFTPVPDPERLMVIQRSRPVQQEDARPPVPS
ncbi:GNAT family N-acetyltransferase [Oryzobacter telluris]|uniref:GNAT family N-acetyltransferase n=1 Tax=Oryzobacter telluris TaxID=3149179 RepID=UPI00370D895B